MKKHLLTLLRVLLALGGAAYILYALSWTDQVRVPAGVSIDEIGPFATERHFTVDQRHADGSATIRIPDPDQPDGSIEKRTPPLSEKESDLQFIPGIRTTLGRADRLLLSAGLLGIVFAVPLQGLRWWILMHCRGMTVGFWRTQRLTLIGTFFNFCMPGTTGGDVIKAWYAAKRADDRVRAVVAIVADRVVGLVALVLLAAIAGLFVLDNPQARALTFNVWGLTLVLVLGAVVYFWRPLRRRLGMDWILARMPGSGLIGRIDEAAVAYGGHPVAVTAAMLLGLTTHLALTTAAIMAGYALGMETPVGLMLVILPLIFIAGSLPITYQGLGVMEGLAMGLLLDPETATANQIVGMLVVYRLYWIVMAASSSLLLLRGDIHMHPETDETSPSTEAVEAPCVGAPEASSAELDGPGGLTGAADSAAREA